MPQVTSKLAVTLNAGMPACQPDATALPVRGTPPAFGTGLEPVRLPSGRPLPDAVAVRAVPVPQTAPPYDDAVPASRRTQGIRPGQGAQRAERQVAAARPVGATVRPARAGDRPARTGDGPGNTAGRPASARAGDWPGQFAQILAETLAGTRQADQLSTWTSQEALRRIRQLGPLLAAPNRPRVRRVIVTSPAGGVLEMTVIVSVGSRARALAVRLEQWPEPHGQARSPRWRCTEIEAA
jgi:Family of unknown function (DUF6459)